MELYIMEEPIQLLESESIIRIIDLCQQQMYNRDCMKILA